MTSFVVITTDQTIIQAIQSSYASDHYKYAANVWFVADEGVTAQDVYKRLIAPKAPGPGGPVAVVCSVGGYYGVTGKDLWEWLAAKGNATKHSGSTT